LLTLGSLAAIGADVFDGRRSGADTLTSGAESGAGDGTASEEADGAGGGSAEPRSFTIAATGELLIHESVAAAAATGGSWDFSPMLSSVAPMIGSADLAICHIESPLSPDNSSLSYYPAFSVPRELARAIADTGYDTCSLASNHALDTGSNGVVGTLTALDDVNVRHAGMARSAGEAETPNLIEVGGVTVAHLSYTYGFNGGDLPAEEPYLSNVIDEEAILSAAAQARDQGAEFVVVSLHWGTEYSAAPDATQTDLGPRLLGSPAIDLIIGHGSHVIQPVTKVGTEYLVYGMGNFLSNQSPESCTGCPPGTQDGLIVEMTVTEAPDGGFTVSEISHVPTWVDRTTYEVVPVLEDAGQRDPTLMAASADRTASALAALGVVVPS
jgi:poly-gamma-glutamate capsule biosynthesis protein CapA/YwtB (metallophosphatase superfamily)